MRIFTCTPVAFGGGPDFFARDSGLLCRGFQSVGVESRAVMPGEPQAGDEPDLIRTSYRNLESPDWWRSQQLDAVVLYAWGRPKFRKVARAIHAAGIFLLLNQDNGGLVSPLAGWRDWLREQFILSGQGRDWKARRAFLMLVVRGMTAGLLLTDPLRAAHLRHGGVIACVSPKAAEHYRKLCRLYGGSALARKVAVIPHAVESRFRDTGIPRMRQVACVGRWSDTIQKRPWLLCRVIGQLLDQDPQVTVVIMGELTEELRRWHGGLEWAMRERVDLRGRAGREELAAVLAESRVFYSPSAFESFGIAAAEALCAGCSVVAGRSVSMSAFEWFVSADSGMLADVDDAAGHVDVLRRELSEWDHGRRDARAISTYWSRRLHADQVAAHILSLANAVTARHVSA